MCTESKFNSKNKLTYSKCRLCSNYFFLFPIEATYHFSVSIETKKSNVNTNPTEDAGPRVWAAQSELWWVEVFPPSGNLINRRLFIDDLWLLLPDDTIWLEKWCYCLQSDYDHTWYFPTTEICLSKHFTHFRHRTDFNGQVHSLQKLSMLWQNSLSETG